MTDNDRVLPPQAAHIAANQGKTETTKYAPSAGHLAAGVGLLILTAILVALAIPAGGGPLALIALITGLVGAGWFVYGVFLFASNVDHIARKI